MASGDNYNFIVQDNSGPIFIEKCELYRHALKTKDYSLIKPFIDPTFHNHPALPNEIESRIKRLYREINQSDYRQESIEVMKVRNPELAGVNIRYISDGGKGRGNSGCSFKRLEANQ